MRKLMSNFRLSLLIIIITTLMASSFLSGCAQSSDSPEPGVSLSEPPQSADESESPIKAFDDFMAALIAFDTDAMKELLSEPSPGNPIIDTDTSIGGIADDYVFETELIKKYTAHVSYSRVSAVYINGDKAEFDVEITVPDIAGAMPGIIDDIVKEAAVGAITGKGFDIEKYLFDYAENKLDFNKMGNLTEITKVYLVKYGGVWLVENDSDKNEGLVRAVTGALTGVIGQYADMLP